MINTCFRGFYGGISPDKRLDRRMEIIATDLVLSGTATVNKAVQDHASKIAFYRTLKNKRIDYIDILSGSFRKCAGNIDLNHVLCIQDTTELNFDHISNKLGKDDPDIGPTTNKKIAGLFCHPVLVCDPSGSQIYGLGSASIYNRKWDNQDKYERGYQKLSIEEKESYRWIENAQNTRDLISNDVTITVVGDRESDIYEEFVRIPNNNTHILVRSRSDRRIEGSTKKLYKKLQEQSLAGTFELKLSANAKRNKRTALIEIRHCEVEILAPALYKGSSKKIRLYAVEAKEVNLDLTKDQSPILWRLLTTHKIENIAQAQQCIDWYKQRWLIEELFRVLKTKGFQIESSQLGTGASIKKLIAFTLEAALQVMRLKLALGEQNTTKAKQVFSDKQLVFMSMLLQKVEGKTVKQQNPYHEQTLGWASWIIARLGKWSGYSSHGPPGYITIKNGYENFNQQYQVFEMLYKPKNVYKD